MTTLQTHAYKDTVRARDYLSFSAVALFAACPLRYYFRYVAGLPEKVISASLVFGSSFHAAAELHFRELLIGHPPPDMDVLLDAFWDSWNGHGHQEIQFPAGEDLSAIGRLAERMLRVFQRSDFAHPAGAIIGVEEELRGELIPGLPDLLARVDLMVDTDDALVVTDLKTARSAWSADHVIDAAGQLLLYHELAKSLADGKPVRLSFAVVTKTKIPLLNIHPVQADPKQIARVKRVVERVWRSIAAGKFYPALSPLNCPTCPYRKPCRAWNG